MANRCPSCHARYQPGGLCPECSVERAHGTPEIPDSATGDDWSVKQEGLGDRDAEGQATLSGEIKSDGGDD